MPDRPPIHRPMGYKSNTQRKQEHDQSRLNAHQRGYDNKWRKARNFYLKENPLCVACKASGELTPATVVDHIKPHKGDMILFWVFDNWQALCKRCHDVKTAREDGAFGR